MRDSIDRNLFFLTGVGQLRNISGFIKQYKATNNVAVVLYTEQNLDVVNNIEKLANEMDFLEVQFVKIPSKILKEEKSKSIEIYNILEHVINDNIKKYGIKNLFICNFTTYYKFFAKIAKHKLSLNLLEEGLTTYRVYFEEKDKKNHKVTIHDLTKKLKKVLKKLYIIFKPIILFIKEIVEFFITLLSYITRINFIYDFNRMKKSVRKYKYGLISKFDNAYICYPDLMKSLNKEIKNVYPLDFNYTEYDVRFTSKEDKENVLFINQKYGIRYKDHFPIIFSILKDMGIKKVYMKFHPKEEMENFKEIFEESKQLYPDLEIITINEYNYIPVENLINTNNITKIIALTSSSLFYSKLVNENIEVISIAQEYKKRCIEQGVAKKRMKTFLNDYEMLDKLFKIEQFEYEENKEEVNSINGGKNNE